MPSIVNLIADMQGHAEDMYGSSTQVGSWAQVAPEDLLPFLMKFSISRMVVKSKMMFIKKDLKRVLLNAAYLFRGDVTNAAVYLFPETSGIAADCTGAHYRFGVCEGPFVRIDPLDLYLMIRNNKGKMGELSLKSNHLQVVLGDSTFTLEGLEIEDPPRVVHAPLLSDLDAYPSKAFRRKIDLLLSLGDDVIHIDLRTGTLNNEATFSEAEAFYWRAPLKKEITSRNAKTLSNMLFNHKGVVYAGYTEESTFFHARGESIFFA